MWSCITYSSKIGASLLYVMMQFSLHLASIKPSPMKSNGQFSRSGRLLVHKFSSSKVVLDSSMKLSSKSTNLKTRLPIGHSSMGGKICTSWITWWLWISVDYSFTWLLVTQALFTMSPSCVSQIYTKIVHTNEYFEYLPKDPGYLDGEMFVMFQLGKFELAHGHDQNVINAYNKMHVGYRVKVEWGIGGVKQKWR